MSQSPVADTQAARDEERRFFKDLDKRLWTTANTLRNNLDAARYKHAVLGLVFLKYVGDAFEARRTEPGSQSRLRHGRPSLQRERLEPGGQKRSLDLRCAAGRGVFK